jgi:hypothetical protein
MEDHHGPQVAITPKELATDTTTANAPNTGATATTGTILALDLGRYKYVVCGRTGDPA